jgi:uncharacterized iron-regulated membrane protein
MAFENMDMEEFETEEQGSPPPEQGNRNFILVAGALGALLLLTLICTGVYAVFFARGPSARQTEAAQILAQNTATALSLQQTEEASRWTPTSPPTATRPPATATTAATAVVVTATSQATTSAETVEADPRTATVAALLTQAAVAQQTVFPTSTLLPTSGFADDVGLPGLMGIGILLIVVIFLARRLRSA